jgi:hypothetical protein
VLYVIALIVAIYAPNQLRRCRAIFGGMCLCHALCSHVSALSLVTPHAQQPTVFGFNEAALNMVGLVEYYCGLVARA